MVGKALINFVPLQERQHLRSFLNHIFESDKDRELIVRLQQRDGESFNANLIGEQCDFVRRPKKQCNR